MLLLLKVAIVALLVRALLAGFAPACLGLIAFAAGFAYCAAQWGLLGGTLLALTLTLLALETLRRLLHRTAVTRAESAA